jgi:mannose/fructose/N-acetylgalactosamine-specific phosphotransferase system component IID
VVVAVVVAQQEFCSTTLYCLLLAAVVVVVVADSVPANRHLDQTARPMLVYMQAKMDKIIPAMVAAAVVVVVAGRVATVVQSGAVTSVH